MSVKSDPRGPAATTYPNTNIMNVPGYPYENMISGDAAVRQKMFAVNSGYDFDRRHGTVFVRYLRPQGRRVL